MFICVRSSLSLYLSWVISVSMYKVTLYSGTVILGMHWNIFTISIIAEYFTTTLILYMKYCIYYNSGVTGTLLFVCVFSFCALHYSASRWRQTTLFMNESFESIQWADSFETRVHSVTKTARHSYRPTQTYISSVCWRIGRLILNILLLESDILAFFRKNIF